MWNVAALYRFVSLSDLPALQSVLKVCAEKNDLCGTLLLAPEGINGTFAAPSMAQLENFLDLLDSHTGARQGELKYSTAENKPFRRAKIRIKKEIVTLRAPEADPNVIVGTYVAPQDWNALISDPTVTVLDTRNIYETAVGIFKGAIDPKIDKFTEFKDYVEKELDPAKHSKIAMFCTGGIRCEKASAYMRTKGFPEVYHLKGGILKYLEEIPKEDSLWEGGCFVFDRRVAVEHGLAETPHKLCYGCRFPITPEETQSPKYEFGVSCPHCHDKLTPDRTNALRERHKQMLAGNL